MTVLTNTFVTTSAVGIREELSDVVSRITPEDTPIYSAMEKGSTESTHPEWETDELNAPGENIHEEGEEYTFAAISPPTKMGDYTQILRKDWILSKSMEAVKDAGAIQKRKKTKLKRGIEIRKDVELAILTNNASVAGTTREFGGLPTWITSNVDRAGSNGGYNSGTGLTVAATDGSQRAFTQTIMNNVAQQGYDEGAAFTTVSVSSYVKSVFVTFMSNSNVASFRYSVDNGKENSIVSNADVYEGPYGKLTIKPNRVQSLSTAVARNVFFLDFDYIEFLWLRKIQEDPDLAKTGDSFKGVIIGEGTLKVSNEKGLGIAADIYGMSAST